MYAVHFNSYAPFKKEYVNFKLAPRNVRGIRSSTKRKALFTWLNERKYDIIFLQETYSNVDEEHIWKTQWKGKLYFSHSFNHSCGVMVLVRSDLDTDLISINSDVDIDSPDGVYQRYLTITYQSFQLRPTSANKGFFTVE